MDCQKDQFSLPNASYYINCAYMSPLLKSVEEAGIRGVRRKCVPYHITSKHFFDDVDEVKKAYSELINVNDFRRIALIPSVSYGMAVVAKNLSASSGQNIVVLEEQFPSNIYTWMRLAEEKGLQIKTVSIPENTAKRGKIWNETLLNSIDANTCLVAIPHVHWADGTKFDLVAVRKKSSTVGALLVIDGTQSVGALPFDVQQIQPDALICGAYKWLLGSYASGVAYFGKYFDKGTPIEENWLNRYESENFANLVNYQSKYQALAARYDMGERGNFIAIPMLQAALNQLNTWGVENIQRYCKEIAQQALVVLQDMGCRIENEAYRSHHLFGVRLPKSIQIERLKQILAEQQVYVSVRGNAIRVSPHVYNTATDVAKLVACFKQAQQ